MSQLAEFRAELCRLSELNQQIALEKSWRHRGAEGRTRLVRYLAEIQGRVSNAREAALGFFEKTSTEARLEAVADDGAMPAWTSMRVPSPAETARQVWDRRLAPGWAAVTARAGAFFARIAPVIAGARSRAARASAAFEASPPAFRRAALALGIAVPASALCVALLLEGSDMGSGAASLLGSAKASTAPGDAWRPLERPIEMFAISAPSFIDGVPVYRAERNLAGPARRDTLSLGSLDNEGPWLAVAFHRELSADGHELAATADRLSSGTATAPTASSTLDSKFGPIVAAEIKAGAAGREHDCLAFGRQETDLRFAFQGLYCAAEGKAADRRTLSCLIDRIEMIGGGSDRQLRGYFVATEKRRDFCGAGDLRATGAKRAWFQGGPVAARPYAGPTTTFAPQTTKTKRRLR